MQESDSAARKPGTGFSWLHGFLLKICLVRLGRSPANYPFPMNSSPASVSRRTFLKSSGLAAATLAGAALAPHGLVPSATAAEPPNAKKKKYPIGIELY